MQKKSTDRVKNTTKKKHPKWNALIKIGGDLLFHKLYTIAKSFSCHINSFFVIIHPISKGNLEENVMYN